MKANLVLNLQMAAPISESAHVIIEACGFRLVTQEIMHLVYEAPNRRLIFSANGHIQFNQLEEDLWQTPFACQIKFVMDEIALLDMLQSLGIINYFKIPEAREVIRQALDLVRTQSVTVSERQIQEAIRA